MPNNWIARAFALLCFVVAFAAGGIAHAAPPANDNFANAATIEYETVTASNVDATLEGGEPQVLTNPGGKSVWWKFTAPASTQVRMTTEGSLVTNPNGGGVTADTLLGVYTGASVGALTLVASNDDDGVNRYSTVLFNMVMGTTYYIKADGWNSGSGPTDAREGTIQLTVSTTDIYTLNIDIIAGQGNVNILNADTSNGTSAIKDYFAGQTARIYANPAVNYIFLRWVKPSLPTTTHSALAEYTFTVFDDESLSAEFIPGGTIYLSVGANGGGSVTGGGAFANGTSRTVTATPLAGYEFVAWTNCSCGSVVSTTPSYTFTVAGDRSLIANFRLRSPKNDLLVDRGAQGTYLFKNNITWLKIHNLSPTVMAAADTSGNGKDEVLLGFNAPAAQKGLWQRLDSGAITRIHASVPLKLATGDLDNSLKEDVVATFQGVVGTWARLNNAGAWIKIHPASALGINVADLNGNMKADVLLTFANGIFARYDNAGAWVQIFTAKPVFVATGDHDNNGKADITISRGAVGIFARSNNAGGFVRTHTANATFLAGGDVDGDRRNDVFAALPNGLWMYRTVINQWLRLHASKPLVITSADMDRNGKDEVAAIFSPGGLQARASATGVWRTILASPVPQDVLGGRFD